MWNLFNLRFCELRGMKVPEVMGKECWPWWDDLEWLSRDLTGRFSTFLIGFKNEDVAIRNRSGGIFNLSCSKGVEIKFDVLPSVSMKSIKLLNFSEIFISKTPACQFPNVCHQLHPKDSLPRALPVALVGHSIKLNNKIRKSTDNFPLSLGQCEN